MYIYSHPRLVATKNRLNFHRIVKYVLCGHKESGACCTCSATYTETSTGQHEWDAIFYCKKAHRTSGAWAILAHMKRSEVPGQLHSTIMPQMLHHEQKYLGMLSTKLLGNWPQLFLFKNDKVSTPDHFLKTQWSKCKQVIIRKKWNELYWWSWVWITNKCLHVVVIMWVPNFRM